MSACKDVRGDNVAEGPPQPFFHSRWSPRPAHVRDLGPAAGLPAGFRAAGVACGIKPSGNPDLGLLVCDAQAPVSAARFTDSGTAAAPVLLSRERCRLGALRAVLANSGCAQRRHRAPGIGRRRQDPGRRRARRGRQ
jgi:glutamate N-acetyltransferase/amino-acid N-acetyltransferase